MHALIVKKGVQIVRMELNGGEPGGAALKGVFKIDETTNAFVERVTQVFCGAEGGGGSGSGGRNGMQGGGAGERSGCRGGLDGIGVVRGGGGMGRVDECVTTRSIDEAVEHFQRFTLYRACATERTRLWIGKEKRDAEER